MNHFASLLICSAGVAAALLTEAASLCAEEAIPTKDVTVENLAKSLYQPGYENFLKTRDRLRKIAKEGPKHQAAAAVKVLQTYAENADRWLFEVGNTEDRQRWRGEELPLGQGRIRGRRGILVSPARVWIKVKDKTRATDMAYLYSYDPAQTVLFVGKELTDDHLRYLSGRKEIVLLEIDDTNVSGAFLADVTLPELRFLHITDSPLHDGAIPQDVLHQLSTADFRGTLITNATLRRMSMKHLDYLNVSNTAVDADGVMLLEKAQKLKRISVDVGALTPDVIEMLSAKESLSSVRIAFRRADVERAAEVARQFPPRVKVSKYEIADEKDYRTRWKEIQSQAHFRE
jgi:hypothetical protein